MASRQQKPQATGLQNATGMQNPAPDTPPMSEKRRGKLPEAQRATVNQTPVPKPPSTSTRKSLEIQDAMMGPAPDPDTPSTSKRPTQKPLENQRAVVRHAWRPDMPSTSTKLARNPLANRDQNARVRRTPAPSQSSQRKRSIRSPPAAEVVFVPTPAPILAEVPRRNDRTNRGPAVQPMVPDHIGPNRDRFSEDKCRKLLILEGSKIVRNHEYLDGFHKVVYMLSAAFGDENLDMSLGVLYEFIEANDNWDTWQDTASFRRWTFHHSRRNDDLTCPHTVRVRNCVVGIIIPTERLKFWREHKRRNQGLLQDVPERPFSPVTESPVSDSPPNSRERGPGGRRHGIINRYSWQIDHTMYISDAAGVTHARWVPTPARLNEVAFQEGVARGERFRGIRPAPVWPATEPSRRASQANGLATPPPTPTESPAKEKTSFLVTVRSVIRKPLIKRQRQNKAKVSLLIRVRHAIKKAFKKDKVQADDNIPLAPFAVPPPRLSEGSLGGGSNEDDVRYWPHQMRRSPVTAETWKGLSTTYYDWEDGTAREPVLDCLPLPEAAKVNGALARKLGLVKLADELPDKYKNFSMETAYDKAVRDDLKLKIRVAERHGLEVADVTSVDTHWCGFNGPFTADMYIDGESDFCWEVHQLRHPSVIEEEPASPSLRPVSPSRQGPREEALAALEAKSPLRFDDDEQAQVSGPYQYSDAPSTPEASYLQRLKDFQREQESTLRQSRPASPQADSQPGFDDHQQEHSPGEYEYRPSSPEASYQPRIDYDQQVRAPTPYQYCAATPQAESQRRSDDHQQADTPSEYQYRPVSETSYLRRLNDFQREQESSPRRSPPASPQVDSQPRFDNHQQSYEPSGYQYRPASPQASYQQCLNDYGGEQESGAHQYSAATPSDSHQPRHDDYQQAAARRPEQYCPISPADESLPRLDDIEQALVPGPVRSPVTSQQANSHPRQDGWTAPHLRNQHQYRAASPEEWTAPHLRGRQYRAASPEAESRPRPEWTPPHLRYPAASPEADSQGQEGSTPPHLRGQHQYLAASTDADSQPPRDECTPPHMRYRAASPQAPSPPRPDEYQPTHVRGRYQNLGATPQNDSEPRLGNSQPSHMRGRHQYGAATPPQRSPPSGLENWQPTLSPQANTEQRPEQSRSSVPGPFQWTARRQLPSGTLDMDNVRTLRAGKQTLL